MKSGERRELIKLYGCPVSEYETDDALFMSFTYSGWRYLNSYATVKLGIVGESILLENKKDFLYVFRQKKSTFLNVVLFPSTGDNVLINQRLDIVFSHMNVIEHIAQVCDYSVDGAFQAFKRLINKSQPILS